MRNIKLFIAALIAPTILAFALTLAGCSHGGDYGYREDNENRYSERNDYQQFDRDRHEGDSQGIYQEDREHHQDHHEDHGYGD